MSNSVWKPHTTVAAVCEKNGKYLLVKEKDQNKIVYNQPAGHLEPNESLIEAVIRETREETGYEFRPTALHGIYRYLPDPLHERSFIRYLFSGELGQNYGGPLDEDIISAIWMSYDEVVSCQNSHRSPLVLQCIKDFQHKPAYPLTIFSELFS